MRLMVISILLLASSNVLAVSFNCKDASSGTEKTICKNKELGALDSTLAATYSKVKKAYPAYIDRNLVLDQRKWIKERDSECRADDVGCLKVSYKNRIWMLNHSMRVDLSGLDFNRHDRVIKLKSRFDGLVDFSGRDIPKFVTEPYTKLSLLKQLINYPFEVGFSPYNTHDHPLKFTKGAKTRAIVSCLDYVKADKAGYKLSTEENFIDVFNYLASCEHKYKIIKSLQHSSS